jgi:hypothetical protein
MTLSTFIKKSKIQYLLVGLVMAFAMNSPEAQAQDDNGPTGYCNLECSNYRGTAFSYTYYANGQHDVASHCFLYNSVSLLC